MWKGLTEKIVGNEQAYKVLLRPSSHQLVQAEVPEGKRKSVKFHCYNPRGVWDRKKGKRRSRFGLPGTQTWKGRAS